MKLSVYLTVLFLCFVVPRSIAFRSGSIGLSAKIMSKSPAQSLFVKEVQRSMFEDKSANLETSVFVPGTFAPMERVVLTANGNLQRILSAYYGSPVTVVVKKCVDLGDGLFDREVEVEVNGKVIYNAVSEVRIVSPESRAAVAEKQVGIGQLFKHFKLSPKFNLLRAGRYSIDNRRSDEESVINNTGVRDAKKMHDCVLDYELSDNFHGGSCSGDGVAVSGVYSLWREYDLYDSDHLHCRITERYTPDFLHLCN